MTHAPKNQRDWVCPFSGCSLAYRYVASLRKHIKTKHGDEKWDLQKNEQSKEMDLEEEKQESELSEPDFEIEFNAPPTATKISKEELLEI